MAAPGALFGTGAIRAAACPGRVQFQLFPPVPVRAGQAEGRGQEAGREVEGPCLGAADYPFPAAAAAG